MNPLLDEDGQAMAGSIAEKSYVDINGVKMGMVIKSENPANPVLLFVHGGPGMPEYPLTDVYTPGLEKLFTVVWWDQRGAGLSYSSDIPVATMTTTQFVADTVGVTNYLRDRFQQDKIYLMGHSWGSYIAIQAAAASPQLYRAYIGVGQISDQMTSEKLAYEYLVDHYAENGDQKTLERLQGFRFEAPDRLPAGYLSMRDAVMHRAGIGTTHAMRSVISGIFLPVMRNREYTLTEKIDIWRGKALSSSTILSHEMYATDLSRTTTRVDIPVYFFSGRFDYTVNHNLSEAYLETLTAPVKGFYLFDDSAHSPIFEEPAKVRQVLQQDVLNGTNDLADTH